MPKKPLQTPQEKILYIMSLLGTNETLDILESEIKSRCSYNSNTRVIPMKRIK